MYMFYSYTIYDITKQLDGLVCVRLMPIILNANALFKAFAKFYLKNVASHMTWSFQIDYTNNSQFLCSCPCCANNRNFYQQTKYELIVCVCVLNETSYGNIEIPAIQIHMSREMPSKSVALCTTISSTTFDSLSNISQIIHKTFSDHN